MSVSYHLRRLVCLWLCLVAAGVSGVASAAEPAKGDPLDWPHWRGPEMNGISREKGLVSSWSPEGENLIWRKETLATRSTPIYMRGRLYTICRSFPETTKEGEKVVCADPLTGDILWENIDNVYLSDAPAERVGWNSVVGDTETGNVFALGLCGTFKCMNGETGKTIWTRSMLEEYGILSTYGGRTNHPTIFEDLVIVSGVMTGWGDFAVPAHRLIAFDKRNGQAVWITSTGLRPPDTTYSTPILATFNGQAAMVLGASDGAVYALQPRTGKVIWKYTASIRGLNQTAVISGNTVYCGHSEEDAADPSVTGTFFAIDGTGSGDISKNKPLWNIPEIASGRSAPLLVNDHLHVVTDNANMFILDPKNGKQIGRQKLGTIMMGSVVYGDGKIYAGEATGRSYILEPTEKGVKVLQALRLDAEEILGSPIISHGRIFLPTNVAMYCIGNKEATPSADPIPSPAAETQTVADTKPAQAQIVPVEALLKPGQKQQFLVRLYNANGRYLDTVRAKFTLTGPGAVNAEGVFSAPADSSHAVTMVSAEVNGVTAAARVRIVPPLPWSFDFADKQIPPTWIGMSYRHQPREVEGNPLLAKITTIPLGTRSQGWFGWPDLHDYTIQADVFAVKNKDNDKMPDVGLINQRYTLDLMGSAQQLQLRSWRSRLELRFAKNVPASWKSDTWYTLKLQSENKDGKVTLRGKFWPRDDKEPADWAIEGTDETPNTSGSPGLYGLSSEAEILIDNVKVTSNK